MAAAAYPLPLGYVSRRPVFTLFLPFDVLDAAGRPVMENRTIAHKDATDSVVDCPYSDYRAGIGKPMNAGALAAFNRLGPRALDLISHYADRVSTMRHIARPDVLQLWRISKLAVSAVARLGVREVVSEKDSQTVDSAAAAVYKVARGLVSLFEELASTQGPFAECTVDSVLTFVEQKQLLEGHREVCAAPIPLIRRVVTHLLRASTEAPTVPDFARDDVKYAALLSIAERVCFACQVVRHNIHGEHSFGLPIRHTFAAARDAALVGQGDPRRAIQALELLVQLHWEEDNPDGEETLGWLVNAGQSIVGAPALEKHLAWEQFRQLAVTALQQVNGKLACLEGSADVRMLTDRDFDLFFGTLSVSA